jgi:hypothetical protein
VNDAEKDVGQSAPEEQLIDFFLLQTISTKRKPRIGLRFLIPHSWSRVLVAPCADGAEQSLERLASSSHPSPWDAQLANQSSPEKAKPLTQLIPPQQYDSGQAEAVGRDRSQPVAIEKIEREIKEPRAKQRGIWR